PPLVSPHRPTTENTPASQNGMLDKSATPLPPPRVSGKRTSPASATIRSENPNASTHPRLQHRSHRAPPHQFRRSRPHPHALHAQLRQGARDSQRRAPHHQPPLRPP